MKKEYHAYAQDNMDREIQWYLSAFERFNRDLARAARIESETATMSKDCYKTLSDFMGLNPDRVVEELRDDKHLKQFLKSIAKQWRHARITKTQRALLGKNAMKQIALIYKTL